MLMMMMDINVDRDDIGGVDYNIQLLVMALLSISADGDIDVVDDDIDVVDDDFGVDRDSAIPDVIACWIRVLLMGLQGVDV